LIALKLRVIFVSPPQSLSRCVGGGGSCCGTMTAAAVAMLVEQRSRSKWMNRSKTESGLAHATV